uniref:Uncharacterized protein n=1 Tax=Picea glauca TaxID=3330 RepID=A0A117NG89_PICGL|nr:hypothetical protein ABT39_MTgene1519 [Picea glauca]
MNQCPINNSHPSYQMGRSRMRKQARPKGEELLVINFNSLILIKESKGLHILIFLIINFAFCSESLGPVSLRQPIPDCRGGSILILILFGNEQKRGPGKE